MAMFGCCCAVQDNAFLELTADDDEPKEYKQTSPHSSSRRYATTPVVKSLPIGIVHRPALSSPLSNGNSRLSSATSSQAGGYSHAGSVSSLERPMATTPVAKAPEIVGPQCFVATVGKPTADTPLGLHMDLSDMALIHVAGLRSGLSPVSSYNESAQPGEAIRAGDYITKVNHVAGDAERMIAEIQANKTLQLEIRRPVTFVAVIPKDDQPMGFELNYAASAQSLVVDSVASGAVRDWGEEHPDKEILTGDRIISVCGKRGTAQELLHTIAANSPVVLEISRPAAFG